MKAIYASDKPKIPQSERFDKTPVPHVEPRDATHDRTTTQIRNNQANAWGTLLTNTNKITGGSKMRNMQRAKQRKIVEISFDPESDDQFPNLLKHKNKTQPRSSHKHKNQNDASSPTSSQGDSLISAVTRVEFETLSQGISQMVKNEVQSTISNGTDQTMITLFRDQMTANREEMAATQLESKNQFALIQQQMNSFQTLIAGLMHHPDTKNTNPPTTNIETPTTSNLKQPPTYKYDEAESSDSDNDKIPAPPQPPTKKGLKRYI
jgi:hypothetical protein